VFVPGFRTSMIGLDAPRCRGQGRCCWCHVREAVKDSSRCYSLGCWIYGPVGLIQEREADRPDGVVADFHGVAVQETSHHAQRHGDIAASRCRPGTWHRNQFRGTAASVLAGRFDMCKGRSWKMSDWRWRVDQAGLGPSSHIDGIIISLPVPRIMTAHSAVSRR